MKETVYQTLGQALDDYCRVDELKGMAKLICAEVPTRKAEIIEAISAALQGEDLKTVFNRLSKIEQYAVAEAAFAPDGKIDFRKFDAKYLGGLNPDQSPGYRGKNNLLGLFIIGNQMPADIRSSLKTFVPKPKSDHVKYVEKLPKSIQSAIKGEPGLTLKIRATSQVALSNLEVVLRLIDGGKLKVGQKTGGPTSATVKNLSKLLHEGDWYNEPDMLDEIGPIQAFAWPIIVQGAGLAKADGSTLKLNNAGKKALAGNLPDVIKTAWKKWEKTKFIDEFSRINEIKGQKSSRGRTLTDPSTRRPVINEALCQCIPGRWIKVEELIRFMHSKGLDFDVARYAWKLYICDARYGCLDDYGNWSIIEGRYLLAFLFEYAATLGLIDVAYAHPAGALPDYYDLWGIDGIDFLSRYDGLKYIRVNSLGAYVLGITDRYSPPVLKTRPVLKVLPNHEIVVTDAVSISPADRLFLDKTCKKVSSSLWQISLQTLLDAAQSGTETKEILSFLRSRSSEAIPQTVITLLDDAKKRTTRLSYSGRAHLIECTDPVLVQLISSDRKLSRMCLPASDRYIVVMPGMEKPFLKALADIGYIVPQFREQI
ncbi:MAG: helicase-associated domain-containing protein [Deltaproteobacteria bacterium]|nr:helicase-associated domain-containing protein [Deltaproteobacteria bacterium]MBW1794485.1 helicase-associated domain-containing protein [Deltaproteobacteria bacterium]MBW2329783.1 helicase-associated domain-containing protein [Deltaproteobacteria bacterium]